MASVGCSDGDAIPAPLPATNADPENELPVATTPLERDILSIMNEAGLPGMQTAVVEDGELIWDQAYGYAVLTPLTRTPMTSDSILAISAVSKMLVAIAVMQQVEAGALSLDDDINAVLPWPVRNPAYPDDAITWRMLLANTSSLQNNERAFDQSYVFGMDHPQSLSDFMSALFAPEGIYYGPDNFQPSQPGSAFYGADFSISLAAYGVELIVGRPFHEYVRERILTPLGMEQTSYFLADLPDELLAVPYNCSVDGGGQRSCFPYTTGDTVLALQYSFPDYPDAGLRTSARQYVKLLAMLIDGGRAGDSVLLQQSSIDEMLTPGSLLGDFNLYWGLGFFVLEDARTWGHGGQDMGLAAVALFDREAGVGAVVLGNSQNDDMNVTDRLVQVATRLLDEQR